MKSVNSLHRSYAIAKFLTYFALIVGALIMIFPFVWMVLTSFKTQAESVSIPATFFPSEFRLDGYKKVLENLPSSSCTGTPSCWYSSAWSSPSPSAPWRATPLPS